jgi:hypothetical protein
VRLSQRGKHLAGARGEALGQLQQQVALRAEALHQRAGSDTGLSGDVGQRQLARSQPLHHLIGGGKDILVADFPGPWAHA